MAAGLAESRLGAQALLDEIMVNRPHGQQRRDG